MNGQRKRNRSDEELPNTSGTIRRNASRGIHTGRGGEQCKLIEKAAAKTADLQTTIFWAAHHSSEP